MTLREFIYARLRDEEEAAARRLMEVQALGLAVPRTMRSIQAALSMHPDAHLLMAAAESHHKTVVWLIERRLWDAPRTARVQTMKALACRWRDHPDYHPEWSPS